MDLYYVNKQPQSDGYHEVHKIGCSHPADEKNRLYLGSFTNCRDAVKEAKETYDKSDGCKYCSEDCHTR